MSVAVFTIGLTLIFIDRAPIRGLVLMCIAIGMPA